MDTNIVMIDTKQPEQQKGAYVGCDERWRPSTAILAQKYNNDFAATAWIDV